MSNIGFTNWVWDWIKGKENVRALHLENALADCSSSLDHLLRFRKSRLTEKQREVHLRRLKEARELLGFVVREKK